MYLISTAAEAALSTAQAIVPMIPPPQGIPGVDQALTTILGWALYLVSILSLIGLLVVVLVGFEAYRHNQGEDMMQKAKRWIFAAILGAYAKDIVRIFLPGFNINVTAVPIPGLDGPAREVVGIIVWIIQWAAFACIIFLAIKGFLAFKDDRGDEFVSKFFWFIVGALGASLATNVAGFFFPAVLTFG